MLLILIINQLLYFFLNSIIQWQKYYKRNHAHITTYYQNNQLIFLRVYIFIKINKKKTNLISCKLNPYLIFLYEIIFV